MRHIHTSRIAGEHLLRLDLVRDAAWTAGSRITGDYTHIRAYVGVGSKRDLVGEWDSRKHSIAEFEPYPLISEEVTLKAGQVVSVSADKNGHEAPALGGFSVQPTIQFKGA